MGQQRFAEALQMFERAQTLDPALEAARLDAGIALYNLQRADAAIATLLAVTQRNPRNAHAWYNLGLIYKGEGQAQPALEAFGNAAEVAPDDADVFYFLGATLAELQHNEQAVERFRHALELNPVHASAEFGLARAYQRLGDSAAARRHLERFQQLTTSKVGLPITLAYGDQGLLSLAVEARPRGSLVPPPIPVRFTDVTAAAGLAVSVVRREVGPAATAGSTACWFDFDNDGLADLFISGPGHAALFRNLGNGRFADVTRSAGLDLKAEVLACAAADFDNDGHTDLAVGLNDAVLLFRNHGDGAFRDVTEAAGLKPHASAAAGLTFVDYDHDGDADLFISSGRAESASGTAVARLWRNNGNGTFTDATNDAGLGARNAAAALGSDVNDDRAVDLVVAGAATQVFFNPREGTWKPSQPWGQEMPSPTLGVAALDFNKDGRMDLAFAHAGAPGITLWRNLDGKTFERVPLPDLHWARAWSVLALDYDNDGWIDLVAVGESSEGRAELRLLRNEGAKGFRDVSAATGLAALNLAGARNVSAADYDADGDTDLLVARQGAPPLLLRNDGGNRNHSLRIHLAGLNDNKSALGTKVQLFAGDLWQKWEVASGGSAGQSALDVLAGLGTRTQADVVRLLWPTGVLQDEVEVAAGTRRNITEIDRRGSSCPVLFAWDGARYRFVSDMIGAGVVGHWIAQGAHNVAVRNVADPTEYLKIDFPIAARDGLLSFRFMEPMEETVYLDQVRLVAVDHPAGARVFPNEYFASNPPFPEFKVIAAQDVAPVAGAWALPGGRDVTARLRAADRQYVAGFELLPFRGFTQPHTLELDLGHAYQGGALRLLMRGYIEYFTATSMFAAHQAGLEPVAPYVEALDAGGRWVRVVEDMGFPAGLPRTTVADLTGRLPLGARRIRITTNLQIYWDQILVDRTPDRTPPAIRLHDVPLANARLRFRGYPRAIEGRSPGDLVYDYSDVSPTGPYARQVGAYTRLGDVRELLSARDDRLVVFGSGDEVALDFDPAHLPPLPAGWKRDYFFFADGYEKDMDFYAAAFDTVAPLPFHTDVAYPAGGFPTDPEHIRYQVEFNTRFSAAEEPRSYRYHYPAARRTH